MTKTIEFIDQTLRDGQQSLWGLRMRAYQAVDALPHLDKTGFKVIDLTGQGMFSVLLRDFADDPWASTDVLVNGLPSNTVRSGMRTISVMGMAHSPDAIIDLWVKTLIKHRVTSFWLFDCLYDMAPMERLVKVVHENGGQPVPSVMYGLSEAYDNSFFAARAGEMASWEGVESLYVEDAAGILTPERARTLLPALRATTGDTPLELHCHNNIGLAPQNYLVGLESGFTVLHTASRPMANGPSLPATETMVAVIEELGYSHRLDKSQLAPVEENFLWAAADAGFSPGAPADYDHAAFRYQLPGGMTGTLKNQLRQYGMEERLQEVLDEIPRVRVELGQPIMATPFSQIVGIQALLNVVSRERYKLVPDEVIHYVLGHYGALRGAVDQNVLDIILSKPRAMELQKWERPQPSLKELRSQFPAGISDEEFLLRYMTSNEEVDRMHRSGPIRTDPRRSTSTIVRHITSLLDEATTATSISIRQPGFKLTASRNSK